MADTPQVDYWDIWQDYAYFLAHSTETASQVAALVRHIDWVAGRAGPARILDFGSGTGEFLAGLLNVRIVPADRLEICIIEPRAPLRDEAVDRLSGFTRRVTAYGDIDHLSGKFDLILANHSLYCAPRPDVTTAQLLNALSTGGRIVAALLDRENALAKIWRAGFALELSGFPFTLGGSEAILSCGLGQNARRSGTESNFRHRIRT